MALFKGSARTITLAVAACVSVLIASSVLVIALRQDDGPSVSHRLRAPRGEGWAGEILLDKPAGQPYVLVGYDLCVTHGSATITDVKVYRPFGRIRVVDWAVHTLRPEDTFGATEGRGLARNYLGFSRRPVTTPCRSKTSTELAVSVVFNGTRAATNGFLISFRDDDGVRGTAISHYEVTMCTTSHCPSHTDHVKGLPTD
jgi:hypothetical protein